MSYEQLATSVDALAEANTALTAQALATQEASITASDNATAKAQEAAQAALSSSESAMVAQEAANLAKDSTDIMDSVEAGIAAGKPYFYTVSPESTQVLVLWKNVSGVAEDTGKRTPALELVEAGKLTSGEVFKTVTTFGQAFNGGVLVVGSDGRNLGVRIPAGETGNTTYIRTELRLKDVISQLVGTRIKIDTYYEATPNFLTNTVMTTLVMQVMRGGSAITVTPETQSLTQVGTTIHKVVTYTIRTGDTDVCPVLRVGVSTFPEDRQAVLKSVVWSVASQPVGNITWSDFHLKYKLDPMDTKMESNTITSGEKYGDDLYAWNGEALNGATRILSGLGNMIGISIPSGVTGATSYVSPFFKLDGQKLAGSTVSVTATYTATENFTTESPPGNAILQVKRGSSSVNVVATNVRVSQVGTTVTKTFDYVVNALDLALSPTYQVGGGSVAVSHVRSIVISSMKYTLSNLPLGVTSADVLLDVQISAAISKIAVRGPEKYVKVADSGGDYLTIDAANNGLASSGLTNPATILTAKAEDTLNTNINDFVSLSGVGSSRVWIHHEAPDNVDPASIPGLQTLYVNKNSTLRNVKVTAKNMRYPIHSESGGAFRNGTIRIIDSHIEHYGNKGAQDYQDAQGSGITVWASWHAWGYGASSGQTVTFERSTLKSPTSAFYMHTNLNFDRPVQVSLKGCELITTNEGGKAVYVQPLGSGQKDSVELIGNMLSGDVYYWMNPWMPSTLDYQPANHCEIAISGYGNSPAVFEILESGRALKIQGVVDASDIVVSGDAVPVLFGKETYTLKGCPGIPGYAYGYADISGTNVGSPTVGNITSLGKRLGNCSVVQKTLTIVSASVSKSVVFNKDYTALSNATILSEINTAFTGVATATAYNIGGRYRPSFTDEESQLMSTASDGILMGTALAFDGSNKNVRKMTSTDPVELFAGIAWEDIYPGTFGRVKTKGYLHVADLSGGIPSTLTYGQKLYVGSTPGVLSLTGTIAIMKAIRKDAVEVAKK